MDDPRFTDKEITFTLSEVEASVVRHVLDSYKCGEEPELDEQIAAKIGSTTTLTHYEAESLRANLEHCGHVALDGSASIADGLAEMICAKLTEAGIAPLE